MVAQVFSPEGKKDTVSICTFKKGVFNSYVSDTHAVVYNLIEPSFNEKVFYFGKRTRGG